MPEIFDFCGVHGFGGVLTLVMFRWGLFYFLVLRSRGCSLNAGNLGYKKSPIKGLVVLLISTYARYLLIKYC